MTEIIFWISLIIVFYTYLGYTLILFLLGIFKKRQKNIFFCENELPEVTHVIAAFNEIDIIPEKIKNCRELDYPRSKITHLWITDGSTDGSDEILKSHPDVKVIHIPQRNGKTAALNRAMKHVTSPITIFSDANSMLSENAAKDIVNCFANKKVGCVAGEKRISSDKDDKAPEAGEGFYWNYESVIKRLESNLNSTMGAVGELYAIRTNLYSFPPENTILDDFVVSLNIARQGFKIKYKQQAIARENASASIKEEMKRKIRIAAGGFQTLFGYPQLLNIFKHPVLSLQFFSHKILRWLFVPLCLLLILFTNIELLFNSESSEFYYTTLGIQILIYVLAIVGFLLRNKSIKLKLLYLPYYVLMMNLTQIAGLFRYLSGKQKAAWDKAKRRPL